MLRSRKQIHVPKYVENVWIGHSHEGVILLLCIWPGSFRVSLSCANWGFCYLNLTGATKFKYEKKNEKNSGRSKKMRIRIQQIKCWTVAKPHFRDKRFGKSIEDHELISLAASHNLQRVFRRILYRNGGSLCQAFLKETVETGTKNRCVIEATNVLRRKLRKD